MFCGWMKELRNVIMKYLIVEIVWKWPLGEHGGSGDVQGFDQEGKEVEWEEI